MRFVNNRLKRKIYIITIKICLNQLNKYFNRHDILKDTSMLKKKEEYKTFLIFYLNTNKSKTLYEEETKKYCFNFGKFLRLFSISTYYY